jgi:hypothetical protein
MTIEKAIKDLLQSDGFKQAAKNDAKLRVYAGRIKKEGVKNGAAIDLLLMFGYKVDVTKNSVKELPKKK